MRRLTTALAWLVRLAAFALLFGLALKNGDIVEVRFYLDGVWRGPLSLVVLVSFGAGILLGLTALAGRARRRNGAGGER